MADVSDPALVEHIDLVRADSTPEDWVALTYQGKTKIVVSGFGTGGYDEMKAHCTSDKVLFILLRLIQGDQESRRIKFVFITFVGEDVGGLARGRVGSHMSNIKPLLGQFNCELRADDVDEMKMDLILKKLKVAGGADYDTGSNAGGYKSSGNIKGRALAAYQEKEKETNIGPVVYTTSALPKETPVDLTGRPMVASASEAQKNTNMALNTERNENIRLSEVARNRPTISKKPAAAPKKEAAPAAEEPAAEEPAAEEPAAAEEEEAPAAEEETAAAEEEAAAAEEEEAEAPAAEEEEEKQEEEEEPAAEED